MSLEENVIVTTVPEIRDFRKFRGELDANNATEMDVFGKEEIAKVDIQKEIDEFPLIPYPDRIYVIEDNVVKSHGLFIPETSRRNGEMQTNQGYVIAVGEGVGFVNTGDRVFYGQYSGAWVMGQKYRVMNEKDLLGRFK